MFYLVELTNGVPRVRPAGKTVNRATLLAARRLVEYQREKKADLAVTDLEDPKQREEYIASIRRYFRETPCYNQGDWKLWLIEEPD